MLARRVLYHILDKLQVPDEPHQGEAIPKESLELFTNPPEGGNAVREARVYEGLTWLCRVDPNIRPDTTAEQRKIGLAAAAGNAAVKKEVALWMLVRSAGDNATAAEPLARGCEPEELLWILEAGMYHGYGRIQIQRGAEGREIHMVGIRKSIKGWDVPTLICDAVGDAELLRAVWPQLEQPEPHGWRLPQRPPWVRVFQCVDRVMPKGAMDVGKGKPEKLEQKAGRARRVWAALLARALEYGGEKVGVIIYKATREWVEKNCSVPDWIKLMHWGDLTGTNTFEDVRALFVVGRPMVPAEAVVRGTEALFGRHILVRGYQSCEKRGRIPIIMDADGYNCIPVDVWEHPDRMTERGRRKITEGGIIQAVGRARAWLRKADKPVDIHLWTDVPIPELGPVEPVYWGELAQGIDGEMLGCEGVWLGNTADAVRAFEGRFTAAALAPPRSRFRPEEVRHLL